MGRQGSFFASTTEPAQPQTIAGMRARVAGRLAQSAKDLLSISDTRVVWRRVIVEATTMWAASRVAMFLLTYAAVAMSQAGYASGYIGHGFRSLVDAWTRWDAQWYIGIASGGYSSQQSTAFFPLYPLTIRGLALIFGPHWALMALVAGNLGTLGAFIGVGLLAAGEDITREDGQRAIRMLAAYPLAFFLAAPYSEGLFLGCAALSLFCARRGKWRWAALWAFLSASTRPTGVILVLPLLWEYGRHRGWWQLTAWRSRVSRLDESMGVRQRLRSVVTTARSRAFVDVFLLMLSVPLAIGLFAAYCWTKFGHPLLFLHAQDIFWHRTSEPLWNTLFGTTRLAFLLPTLSFWQFRLLVDLGPVLIYLCITILTARRVPFAFTLYLLGLYYLTVANPVVLRLEPDPLFSAGRFLIEAAPMYVLLGQWSRRRPWLDLLLVSSGFLLQAILGMYFLNGGWMV